ncbi:histidine-type phosphatase [Alkalimonas sp. NCh-2]|uniref:histidine-type phosphatase n=1 Tax=Alkalimonas sp. NCh-2 TaxID=3144846 RepID=UPI0031F67176
MQVLKKFVVPGAAARRFALGCVLGVSSALCMATVQSSALSSVTLWGEPWGEQWQLYGSKAPYQPRQHWQSYEVAPAGFTAVMVQHVARHGSRGLSSPDDDDLSLQLWQQAQQEQQLTAKGQQLGEQLRRFQQANAQLGYGNLSALGIEEHRQMAERLLQRHPALLAEGKAQQRRVRLQHSGRERAVDSALAFADRLLELVPELEALLDAPAVATDSLYFHKSAGSEAYSAYRKSDPRLALVLERLHQSPQAQQQARQLLATVYQEDFIARLAAGHYRFQAREDDAELRSVMDAAQALFSLYVTASNLSYEGDWTLHDFMEPEAVKFMAYLDDAESFYQRGPAFAGENVTFQMAARLMLDMLDSVAALQRGEQPYMMELRFTHAQVMIPFATLLGVAGATQQMPETVLYSYQNNPWRAALVSPMAANVQWDIYQNAAGQLLVRMLHHEAETAFKASCQPYPGTRFFYALTELQRCYQQELSLVAQ